MQMFSVAVLGISVSHAFSDLTLQFTLADVLTRLVLVLMYLRMARVHPQPRGFQSTMRSRLGWEQSYG
jgi:low temperature requirement protein LtrA